MIKVQYSPDCAWLQSMGHAGYAEEGKDIVCAGVSALMMAAVTALLEKKAQGIVEINPKVGKIYAESILDSVGETILYTAAVGLRKLAEQYPDYVSFEEVE